MTETPKAHIAGIQYLRGIAAMAVCLYHISGAQFQQFPSHSAFIPKIYGLWGVDVFFVISGFIVVYITANYRNSFGDTLLFWKGRLAKIVPAYWLFTLITALFMLMLHKYDPAIKPVKIKELLMSLSFLQFDGFPVLLVGWTLNYEIFFYFIYGMAMTLSHRYRIHIVTVILGMFVLVGSLVKLKIPAYNFLTQPIIIEFVFGMVIAATYNKNKTLLKIYTYTTVVAAFIVMIAASMMYSETFLLKNRLFIFGVPAGLLVWGTLYAQFNTKMRWLSVLGDISYSVYLSHLVVGSALVIILKSIPIAGINPNILLVLIGIPLIIVISMISHEYIEKRFSNYLKR